ITTNWRNYIGQYEPEGQYVRAFNIPMSDIQNLGDFTDCSSVRAYLAMETPGDISSLKIILVPVDQKNNDVLSIEVPSEGGGMVEQSAIYDFTSPCPSVCDVNSPLFS
ncbi:MAG: hypothetical protein KA319_13930, partial [Ferruginibacter sp.]|nr:hypothetical protein [Ferruginibacter sp.]